MVIPFVQRHASRNSAGPALAQVSVGLQRLVDAVDALVVVARLDGTLWSWNRRCDEVSWAALGSVAGKPLWTVMRLRPAQQREAQAAFERLISGRDQSVSFHSLWVRKDGRKTRISWAARLVNDGPRPGFVVATGVETTRGRKLVRELEETESRFATLFELLPDPVVVHQDGRLLHVNRAGVRMYGAASSDDFVGMPVADRVAPEWRPLLRDRLVRLMQGESVPMAEERHLTMDGRPFDVEVVAAPVSMNGRPAVVLAARDITARKATEAALSESEAKMRSLLEAAPVVVWAASRDGVLTSVYGRALQVLGQPPETLVGRSLSAVFGDLPDFSDAVRRAYRGKSVIVRIHPPGRALECRLTPVFDAAGAVEGAIGVTSDVADSEAAETVRHETEERIRAVFDESALGMILVDRDGHSLESNRAFQLLLGYGQDELKAMSTTDYTHLADRAANEQALSDVFAGVTEGSQLEARYIAKDGSEIWTRVHLSPVRDPSGTPRMAVGTVEDITAHKSLEEQLRQASKMEALGRLAGGVAHDFNNLLTVVNGYADILVDALGDDERAVDAVEIRRAGSRATELTAQLLAFGRRSSQTLEPVDLNSQISALVPMLRRLLGEDIEFEVRLDPRIGAVDADPSQLDQVVMNLVVNARDAMLNGGQLKLTTSHVEALAPADVGHDSSRTWARLEISDSGVGIEPAVLDRIFEPFFTTKQKGRGTGLGLATVYSIVEQMAGRIRAESSVGSGARFIVDLPLSKELPAAAATSETNGSGRGSETILLVEDEQAVRDFCKRALESEGYRVVAGGPAEALALGSGLGSDFDLLVTDVVMPDIDGPAIAAALTKVRPGLKVLFMSGYPRDRHEEQVGSPAGASVLGKPFSSRELGEAVRRVLDRPDGADGSDGEELRVRP